MKLKHSDWGKISAFIFLDLKIDSANTGTTTAKSRYRILVNFLEEKNLSFNRQSFILFIDSKKQEGCKHSYLNNLIKFGKYIHLYFLKTYKYDSGIADFTYFKKEKPIFVLPTTQEVINIAELEYPYIRQRADKNYKFKCLYYFLAKTGARINEALMLKWVDINAEVCIFRDTKNNRERIVSVKGKLWQLINSLPQESDYVFGGRVKGHMTPSGINDDIHKRCKVLGIKKRIWCHLFRHYCAVELIKRNDVTIVSHILGHTELSSTMHYIHYLADDIHSAMATHPLLKDTEDFVSLKERLKQTINKLVDINLFKVQTEDSQDSFTIRILKNANMFTSNRL